MSDYRHYLKEKEKVDFLIQNGYRIKDVLENLSGAFVQFERVINEVEEIETLHILTADGRKYFSVMMIAQNQG